jgi:hypothetical protein
MVVQIQICKRGETTASLGPFAARATPVISEAEALPGVQDGLRQRPCRRETLRVRRGNGKALSVVRQPGLGKRGRLRDAPRRQPRSGGNMNGEQNTTAVSCPARRWCCRAAAVQHQTVVAGVAVAARARPIEELRRDRIHSGGTSPLVIDADRVKRARQD